MTTRIGLSTFVFSSEGYPVGEGIPNEHLLATIQIASTEHPLLLPVDHIIPPDTAITLAQAIPPFSVRDAAFPTNWADTTDECLLSSRPNGFKFWAPQLLSKAERPIPPESDPRATWQEVLSVEFLDERNAQLSSALSCIAFSESLSGCDDALRDPYRHICGGTFLRNGAGLGGKMIKRNGITLSTWSTDYISFDISHLTVDDFRDMSAPSHPGELHLCYGLRKAEDILEWRVILMDPHPIRPSRYPKHDLTHLKNHLTADQYHDTDDLWSEWLRARKLNRMMLKSKLQQYDVNYVQALPDPIFRVTFPEVIGIGDELPIVTSINGIPTPHLLRTLTPSSDVPDGDVMTFRTHLRQWISPGWSLNLRVQTDVTTPIPSTGRLALKAEFNTDDEPCNALVMTDSIAVVGLRPGLVSDDESTKEHRYVVSFWGKAEKQFLQRAHSWMLLLKRSASPLLSRGSSRLVLLKGALCYYPSPSSVRGHHWGDAEIVMGHSEYVIFGGIVIFISIFVPIVFIVACSLHFHAMKKFRLKICRENLRYSRDALEAQFKTLTAEVTRGDDEYEDSSEDAGLSTTFDDGGNDLTKASRNLFSILNE